MRSIPVEDEKLLFRCSWMVRLRGEAAVFVVNASQIHVFMEFRLKGGVNQPSALVIGYNRLQGFANFGALSLFTL